MIGYGAPKGAGYFPLVFKQSVESLIAMNQARTILDILGIQGHGYSCGAGYGDRDGFGAGTGYGRYSGYGTGAGHGYRDGNGWGDGDTGTGKGSGYEQPTSGHHPDLYPNMAELEFLILLLESE